MRKAAVPSATPSSLEMHTPRAHRTCLYSMSSRNSPTLDKQGHRGRAGETQGLYTTLCGDLAAHRVDGTREEHLTQSWDVVRGQIFPSVRNAHECLLQQATATPEIEHPRDFTLFFFPLFFPLPAEHCYTLRAAQEPLFNVTCVAKVPQAPAAAAWDICTYPSQWKEEGVGGRIRLLTPLLFLGQKKASSWLKNHGAEKVFQPERVRWSHWGFFFCLSPSPASPFGQAAGSHRAVLHSQNTCCTSRSPSPRRRGKALEPKQTKINHFSLQI